MAYSFNSGGISPTIPIFNPPGSTTTASTGMSGPALGEGGVTSTQTAQVAEGGMTMNCIQSPCPGSTGGMGDASAPLKPMANTSSAGSDSVVTARSAALGMSGGIPWRLILLGVGAWYLLKGK